MKEMCKAQIWKNYSEKSSKFNMGKGTNRLTNHILSFANKSLKGRKIILLLNENTYANQSWATT